MHPTSPGSDAELDAAPGPVPAAEQRLCVLVATRDRRASLARLLGSLDTEWAHIDRAVVVDNGSTDGTDELLRRAAADQPKLTRLECAAIGKSRALNRGLDSVDAPVVAFLDDDVVVQPGWAAALRRAAGDDDAPAWQGCILPPADVRSDPGRSARWRLYGTLPMVTAPHARRPTLTGANMAIRREVLEEVGGFDERLGPGAAGLSEDTELAQRITRSFGPPGFVSEAVVEHEWDADRLTPGYFRAYCRRMGRSRFVQKRNPLLFSILPNMARSGLLAALTRPLGEDRRHLRHVGRFLHYREMLRAWRGSRSEGRGADRRLDLQTVESEAT